MSLRALQGRNASARQHILLALSATASLVAAPAAAQEAPAESPEGAIALDTVRVEDRAIDTNPYAERDAPYKARVSGDERHVAPLAETPQTITVLTQTQIKDAGVTDLRDILSAQPGVTLGTGENGNAFGDRYIIRGHEARSDVFVDGLRDPGMTIRESFAVEQIEITKGPSSTFAGRGSTGGAVNSITKQASPDYNFNKLEVGLGTDEHRRLTLDSNIPLGDAVAVRANLLHAYEEVPDRSPADRERTGAALSAAFQVNPAWKVIADYYYLDARDRPDIGTFIVPDGGKPYKNIPSYSQDQDFLFSKVHVGTLRTAYEASDTFRLVNAVRYGTTDNGYVVTGARGASRAASDADAPGQDTITLSTHQGWQEVEYFVDNLNLYWDANLAGAPHRFVFGAEYSDLEVTNGVYDVSNTGASNCRALGRGGDADAYCILGPGGAPVRNIGSLLGRSIARGDADSEYRIKTVSAYAMDTVDLTDRFSLFLGVRYDSFDYGNDVVSRGVLAAYDYSDDLWNGHVGLVYHVTDVSNVYFTYSTSAEINGGESDVGGNCGYGGLCGTPDQVVLSKPESVENLELGAKWNLFGEKLLFTAAAFQITKDDVMESVGDAYSSLGTLNTGRNRVRGVEFGLVGNLTEDLSVQAGASFMKSKILKAFNTAEIGRRLSNFADDTAYLQLRYQATKDFSFGGAVTYSSAMYTGQPDTAAGFNSALGVYSYKVPGYATLDLFANYQINERFKLRLNIANVTDKAYYLAGYRSGSFTYIGDARNAQLTLSAEF